MRTRNPNPEKLSAILPRVMDGIRPTPPAERPRYVVVLTPMLGADPVLGLRRLLKLAGRACGLRCLSIEEIPAVTDGITLPSSTAILKG
ncbi:MAG: hypothetical protein K8S99_06905 [Planctomycetes bacterium]|nr:hypothetical protein [Planctomycetota bacterium]